MDARSPGWAKTILGRLGIKGYLESQFAKTVYFLLFRINCTKFSGTGREPHFFLWHRITSPYPQHKHRIYICIRYTGLNDKLLPRWCKHTKTMRAYLTQTDNPLAKPKRFHDGGGRPFLSGGCGCRCYHVSSDHRRFCCCSCRCCCVHCKRYRRYYHYHYNYFYHFLCHDRADRRRCYRFCHWDYRSAQSQKSRRSNNGGLVGEIACRAVGGPLFDVSDGNDGSDDNDDSVKR